MLFKKERKNGDCIFCELSVPFVQNRVADENKRNEGHPTTRNDRWRRPKNHLNKRQGQHWIRSCLDDVAGTKGEREIRSEALKRAQMKMKRERWDPMIKASFRLAPIVINVCLDVWYAFWCQVWESDKLFHIRFVIERKSIGIANVWWNFYRRY